MSGLERTVQGRTQLVSAGIFLRRDRAVGSNVTAAYGQAITVGVAAKPSAWHERGAATHVWFMPFAIGNAAVTYGMRVLRWYTDEVLASATSGAVSGAPNLYVPQVACELTCTSGTGPIGIAANTLLLDTERIAKTIVSVVSPSAPQIDIYSPVTDYYAGSVLLDLQGCAGFTFDYSVATATSANCLYGVL